MTSQVTTNLIETNERRVGKAAEGALQSGVLLTGICDKRVRCLKVGRSK